MFYIFRDGPEHGIFLAIAIVKLSDCYNDDLNLKAVSRRQLFISEFTPLFLITEMVLPTTNRYYDFNANLMCGVMDEKCNLQCLKLKKHNRKCYGIQVTIIQQPVIRCS